MHDNYIRVDLKWVPRKRNGQDEDNAQVQQVPPFPDCYLAYEIYIGTGFKQPARIEIKAPLSHCITTKSFVHFSLDEAKIIVKTSVCIDSVNCRLRR